MRKKILIVEDDQDIVSLLRHYLNQENFDSIVAVTGGSALNLAKSRSPDLVILDLMLPEMDGLEVCREFRREAHTSNIPILMLTAKGEELDKIVGLEVGADDYLTKPFSPKELIARIKALLRRYQRLAEKEKLHKYGRLALDAERHEVSYAGKSVELTAKEFGLLEALLRNVGRVLTRGSLLNAVWGEDYYGGGRTVDVHIRKLREKIPVLSEDILAIKGRGYKLKAK